MAARTPIRELSCDAIRVMPRDYSWDTEKHDWEGTSNEGWAFTEAARCEKCHAILVTSHGASETHRDLDQDSDCDGWVPGSDGPMMSYFYPLAIDDADDAARKIVDLPLCVVSVDGTTGLALTGGGMDLSWEICEPFMRLGSLPPVHFADVPDMARELTRTRQWVLAGCARACLVSQRWAQSTRRRINTTRKSMRERSKASRTAA